MHKDKVDTKINPMAIFTKAFGRKIFSMEKENNGMLKAETYSKDNLCMAVNLARVSILKKVGLNIKATFIMGYVMEMENIPLIKNNGMLGNGNLDVFKEKENITILMETYTMESFKMEKNKEMEDTSLQQAIHMTVNGLMAKCMEEE